MNAKAICHSLCQESMLFKTYAIRIYLGDFAVFPLSGWQRFAIGFVFPGKKKQLETLVILGMEVHVTVELFPENFVFALSASLEQFEVILH